MLGSVHDADDALQETLIRAWRGAAGLKDERAARSWLYRIATNACLTEIGRRRTRVLPHDFGPSVDADTPPGVPITESIWLEPYPTATPESTYEQNEGIELAFVAALQHLGGQQRATLILREVLGFSAQETATMLSTTVAAVTSALQRARVAVAAKVPGRSQQATLQALGDQALTELVDRYVDAWQRCDVTAFAALLVEDATFAMPPLTTWYTPRDTIIGWARGSSLSGAWRWKAVRTWANAQPALAFYAWDVKADAFLPFALNVLTLRGTLISDVTAFIVRTTDAPEAQDYRRFPEQPIDQTRVSATFERFGLPERLSETAN